MAKIVLQETNSGYNLSKINSNFDAIEEFLNEEVLSRDNPTADPNQMLVDLDMNGKRVFNLPAPVALSEAVRLQDILNISTGGIGSLPASVITNIPGHTIAATNVQAALYELSDDTTVVAASVTAEALARSNADATLTANVSAANTNASAAVTTANATNTLLASRLPFVVDTVAAMRTFPHATASTMLTRGYFAVGDGGDGVYRYDSTDTTTADNGGSVIVAADGARWKLFQTMPFTIRQFGAVGDGTTNDYPAINNALTATANGGNVLVPPGTYRVATGVSLTNGKSLIPQSLGNVNGQTTAILIADLAVTPTLTLNGGAGSGASTASGITVTRATGTPPAGSIGVLVMSSNMSVLQDVYSIRSDIGFSIDGNGNTNLGIRLNRCLTGQIVSRHIQISNSVETTVTDCRFGRNGGGDFTCTDFVAIVGTAVDTVRFNACQFNQSGGPITQVIHFYGYVGNPNGIITFAQCHMESWSTSVVTADASSTIPRLRFIGCSINGTGAFTSVTPGNLSEFMLTGNTIDGAISLTLDQQKLSVISGNHFGGTGAILINQGTQTITGNYFDGAVTLQGATTKTVFVGNACGSLANTMTGTTAITGNI